VTVSTRHKGRSILTFWMIIDWQFKCQHRIPGTCHLAAEISTARRNRALPEMTSATQLMGDHQNNVSGPLSSERQLALGQGLSALVLGQWSNEFENWNTRTPCQRKTLDTDASICVQLIKRRGRDSLNAQFAAETACVNLKRSNNLARLVSWCCQELAIPRSIQSAAKLPQLP
jgi:hypothetical protein